ncbi:MAG: hypothetical protein GY875_13420 [Gammaproteobacteria bacterium]|nr:hypothetical protein [Gammaproteobacteria bacterium]
MRNCASFSNDLDLYRDLALPTDRQREVQAHVERCEHCRTELQRAQAVEAEIRSSAADWHPSPDLWRRIKHSAEQQNRRGNDRGEMRKPVVWMSAALLMISVAVTGFTLLKPNTSNSAEVVASALINEFHTFVASHRALDFSDTQPAKIRSWFGDKVDFRVPLPVKSADLQLAGGRLCNMLDQRIASFMYQVDDAWVSLYIMRSVSASQSPGASNELLLQGYGFIDWESQGLHYSLVGDLPVERLREIAERLRSTRILTRLPELQGASITTVSGAEVATRNGRPRLRWQI